MNGTEKLLLENKAWAQEQRIRDPAYFARLEQEQAKFLWIGCSDSHVSPEEITNAGHSRIFVHRNVANLVVTTDLNLLSVLQYAVADLQVEHVILCGHYGCGGIERALQKQHSERDLINKWLKSLKDVYRLHREELDRCPTDAARADRLAEINVTEQVHNLAHLSIIQKAWRWKHRPVLHGWMYDAREGLLKELLRLEPGAQLDPLYAYDLE